MAFIARLCLLGLLLGYAAMCFARNMPKGNQNRQYEVDDYGEPVPNPAHDPYNPPPPPPRGNENNQYEINDYGGTGPNPIHDPHNTPPPPPLPSRVYPKMDIHVENYEGTWAKPKRDPHSATPLMSEGTVLEPSKVH